jgi:voltage-gated potassium channel
MSTSALTPKPARRSKPKGKKRTWMQRLSQPRYLGSGLAQVLVLAVVVLVACGVGYFALDPAVETLEDGLWLAFTTAATVGYGDVIPSSRTSRVFSVIVVLLGFAILSLVTASISAKLVGTQERRMERDILRDLHAQMRMLRQELAELKAQQADLLARKTAEPAQASDPQRACEPTCEAQSTGA